MRYNPGPDPYAQYRRLGDESGSSAVSDSSFARFLPRYAVLAAVRLTAAWCAAPELTAVSPLMLELSIEMKQFQRLCRIVVTTPSVSAASARPEQRHGPVRSRRTRHIADVINQQGWFVSQVSRQQPKAWYRIDINAPRPQAV
jgi:hypothetical protein